MNVYQKLNAARTKFHSLKLQKTGHNKFAGYHYFELGDFLIPALKVFDEVGLCAVVSFDADKACMIVRNAEKPDEYLTIYSPMGSAALKGCHEVQNIGAVETYQRRYLWVAALEIVEHDALDATTGSPEKKQKPELQAVNPVAEVAAQLQEHATEERLNELQELALYMVDCHKEGKTNQAIDLWYAADTFSSDVTMKPLEQTYVWNLLKSESALRSRIKANKPGNAVNA